MCRNLTRAAVLAVAATGAMAAVPAASEAATMVYRLSGLTLEYQAAFGEANDLEVTRLANGRLRFTDVVSINTTAGCTRVTATTVDCLPPDAEVNVFARDLDDTVLLNVTGTRRYVMSVDAGDGADYVSGSSARDRLSGDAGADLIFGMAGDDALDGGANDDTLFGGPGRDSLRGSGGLDTVSYFDRSAGVIASIDGVANDGLTGEGDNILTDVENLDGTPRDDTLVGGSGSNTIRGFSGNDVISGRGGSDRVEGGIGDDELSVRDNEQDIVDCGGNTDLVRRDAGLDILVVPSACETFG